MDSQESLLNHDEASFLVKSCGRTGEGLLVTECGWEVHLEEASDKNLKSLLRHRLKYLHLKAEQAYKIFPGKKNFHFAYT